jgi:hypothetical protein
VPQPSVQTAKINIDNKGKLVNNISVNPSNSGEFSGRGRDAALLASLVPPSLSAKQLGYQRSTLTLFLEV